MKSLLLTLLLAFTMLTATAQRTVGLAYYEVDRLYDTIPALFYDDKEFTPGGRMHWDSERYHRKIQNTAALLDSMGMELVALSGIETEDAVRDLVSACREEYSYLHRTISNYDGLDIALLYHGDRFVPIFAEEGRGWLYIEGRLDGVRIGLLLCRNARYGSPALKACIAAHPQVRIVAAGRFSAQAGPANLMTDAQARAERAGRGNIRYASGWRMYDRILADTAMHTHAGDVFARHWLMDASKGSPLPTYDRTTYRGGYSRWLPVFVYFTPAARK